MNTFGNNLRLTIFGTSHGSALGLVIDGLPVGIGLDEDAIRRDLARRRPKESYATARVEYDEYEIIAGIYNGKTSGTPLTVIMKNADISDKPYEKTNIPRPSHADYAARIKYHGFNDPHGGGMFSGRMTALLVFAGAIARQILEKRGIFVGAHIAQMGEVYDEPFDFVRVDKTDFDKLDPYFPVNSDVAGEKMREILNSARADGDSIGASVECAAVGIEAGIGEPFFDSCESVIAHMLFSIGAVKSVEFGAGVTFASMRGSIANDGFSFANGRVVTNKNDSGGINGGITNGMPLIVRAAFRPVPTVSREQDSVDLINMENVKKAWSGRHDGCILPRGVVVIESGVCFALLDLLLEAQKRRNIL